MMQNQEQGEEPTGGGVGSREVCAGSGQPLDDVLLVSCRTRHNQQL